MGISSWTDKSVTVDNWWFGGLWNAHFSKFMTEDEVIMALFLTSSSCKMSIFVSSVLYPLLLQRRLIEVNFKFCVERRIRIDRGEHTRESVQWYSSLNGLSGKNDASKLLMFIKSEWYSLQSELNNWIK